MNVIKKALKILKDDYEKLVINLDKKQFEKLLNNLYTYNIKGADFRWLAKVKGFYTIVFNYLNSDKGKSYYDLRVIDFDDILLYAILNEDELTNILKVFEKDLYKKFSLKKKKRYKHWNFINFCYALERDLYNKFRKTNGFFRKNTKLYLVDTSLTPDTELWETAIIDKLTNDVVIVEQYKDKESAKKGHYNYVKNIKYIDDVILEKLNIYDF